MDTTPLTLEAVFDLLPLVANQPWKITLGGNIRTGPDRICPLCALAKEIDPDSPYREAAISAFGALGMQHPIAKIIGKIMGAADFPDHHLRPALMQALEMTP